MSPATGAVTVGPVVAVLDAATAREVRAVVAAAAAADGVAPLNEAGLLALAGPVPGRLHLLARAPAGGPALAGAGAVPGGAAAPGPVVGYAGVDTGHSPAAAELLVAPAARRAGTGTALAAAVRADPRSAGVGFWAHGDLPPARALARTAGLSATRRLARMRRPANTPLPAAPLAAGVRLAAFRPGTDEDAWLRVNAAAFAGHPEQGRWTRADLAVRTAEDWFDPAGLLLAWRDDPAGDDPAGGGPRLLGSHWTKLTDDRERVGEVYVLGVDPDTQAAGLGTALAVAGLRSLADRGARDVELYVEADSRAVALYRRLGFVDDTLDVVYS